jgi:hypothetical protein
MAETQLAPACPVFLRVQGIKGAVRKNSVKVEQSSDSASKPGDFFPQQFEKTFGKFLGMTSSPIESSQLRRYS